MTSLHAGTMEQFAIRQITASRKIPLRAIAILHAFSLKLSKLFESEGLKRQSNQNDSHTLWTTTKHSIQCSKFFLADLFTVVASPLVQHSTVRTEEQAKENAVPTIYYTRLLLVIQFSLSFKT